MKKLSLFIFALFLGSIAAAPVSAKVGSANFSGIVSHISSNNIKVHNPANGQDLSFLIVPRFANVFSGDGKTTYQMSAIKAGQYVKVYYDQKFLGQRHADRILILRQNNTVKGKQ